MRPVPVVPEYSIELARAKVSKKLKEQGREGPVSVATFRRWRSHLSIEGRYLDDEQVWLLVILGLYMPDSADAETAVEKTIQFAEEHQHEQCA